MKKIKFRHEPAAYAVYQVQENCCYVKVVYDGPQKGIYWVNDRENEKIGPLLCCICDPQRKIMEVSADFYQTYYKLVQPGAATA
jgi:hypothetical protein